MHPKPTFSSIPRSVDAPQIPLWRQLQGASSLLFLEVLPAMLRKKHERIANIDAVVICERPKLGPHFPAMRDILARALGIRAGQINLKAKTNEGVDAVGRGEAIAAYAVVTLESRGSVRRSTRGKSR